VAGASLSSDEVIVPRLCAQHAGAITDFRRRRGRRMAIAPVRKLANRAVTVTVVSRDSAAPSASA
jgi:hypothetical protein